MVKPFEPQQLVARVRNLIEKKAADLGATNRIGESELDGYFNRLDAAFAELGSTMNQTPAPRLSGGDQYDGGDVPTLESLLSVSSATRHQNSAPSAGGAPDEFPGYPPAPTRSTASHPETGGDAVNRRNLVAEMFTARFAAEQREQVTPAAAFQAAHTQTPVVVTDALVDEVTRRVIDRLASGAANELVARLVSEAAERLIREEISRVKAEAAARV
jgi:hypothetical protein